MKRPILCYTAFHHKIIWPVRFLYLIYIPYRFSFSIFVMYIIMISRNYMPARVKTG